MAVANPKTEKLSNKEKRIPKTEKKINITLNEEQKKVHEDFHNYDVNFIIGEAGSGKTQIAAVMALKSFCERKCNKIIITRPIVKDSLGFLPGNKDEKMRPWISPIMYCLEKVLNKEIIEKMLSEGDIEILPIDYIKGITYTNSVVIVDEFQDMKYSDFYMTLTRLGKDSKLIYTGSKQQIHPDMKVNSCIYKIEKTMQESKNVAFNILLTNHRHEVIFKIIEELEANGN